MVAVLLALAACVADDPSEHGTETGTRSETSATDPVTEYTETEETTDAPFETEPVITEPPVTTEQPVPDAPLAAVTLADQNGGSINGVTLNVDGDMAVIKVPLILSEAVLKNAEVGFVTTHGTVIAPQKMDLTGECRIEIPDGNGNTVTCTVTAERESYGLPLLEIHTDGGAAIVEKNTYIHGRLTVDGEEHLMKIKGRGNASWNYFPKKAYRIKLDSGASILGLTKNRDWVLVSNYADKSLIRNCVASSIASSLSGLEYTSTHIPVNLYINGEYMGVYTFADKIEAGKGRLDLGDPVYGANGVEDVGFLLEIGWDFDGENVYNKDFFNTEWAFRIYVKEPEIPQANTPEFTFIKNYVIATENALLNGGWENYIDLDSWVDWFIVNELTFNTESSFYRSCYLWKPAGGKLRLGPVWDFDMAFGNHYGDLPGYNGWCTTESTYQYLYTNWMNLLIRYPAFTDRLVERWNEVKDSLLVTSLEAIDTYSEMLDGSEQQNFKRWDIMGVGVGMGSVDIYTYNTYDKQVQYLRDFINTRWQYIDNRLNSGEY